jgi:N,N-dimethylformamidase
MLTGYTDLWSAAPGETVSFKVSTDAPEFEASIVRLFHGDRNPNGPGLKEEVIHASIAGRYPGRVQKAHPGSFGLVEGIETAGASFGCALWVYPTTPAWDQPQCIVSRCDPDGTGFKILIEGQRLALKVVDRSGQSLELRPEAQLEERRWYFIHAGYDVEGSASLHFRSKDWPEIEGGDSAVAADRDCTNLSGPLYVAAAGTYPDGSVRAGYNGKVASLRLFDRPLRPVEVTQYLEGTGATDLAPDAVVGAWNLSSRPESINFDDESGKSPPGVLVNRPASAMTGPRWRGASDWRMAGDEFDAVHFHTDDLIDAAWETDFSWELPGDIESGVYAARLRADGQEDHIPFSIRPPAGKATAEVGYLLPTFTYLAYANERVIETGGGFEQSGIFTEIDHDPRDAEWAEHREFGLSLYDHHEDGSGCCYASFKRPILNIRPDYKMWATRAPRHFGGDLYMVDWLTERGFKHDVITDHDLQREGKDLLSRYRVIITGSHPEYYTEKMLDAVRGYLDGGGRLMYLGGNGFYWVTSVDPTDPNVIEVRRGYSGTRVWESQPGEYCHSTTGERGGLWRYRGRSPNALTGVGFASEGCSKVSPGYARNPDARGPVAEMVFDGVDEEIIGNYGLVMGGAAGDEIDRADGRYGTPSRTILLASSTGHDSCYQLVVEDVYAGSPNLGGPDNPDVRSDIAFTEMPNHGAVFSAGAISWSGSLSHNNYENGVSRITENVLRAFLSVEAWAGNQ